MSSIQASIFDSVTPSVLSAGGNALDIIGLVLTTNTRVPIGTVLGFPGVTEVQDFFGPGSLATLAGVYFEGFTGSDALPGSLLFAQYNQVAVAAYLRGGPVGASLTLAQLQALSGSLTVVVDGYSHVISSISFSADNSFSAAAAAIQAAFTDPTESSFTASLGASFTGNGSGTNLTASSVTGLISAGDAVTGAGVPANTVIVSQTSGSTGGAGVYVTNNPTTSSTASLTSTSTVLDVTGITSGTVSVGQTLAGTSVIGTPLITAQLTGTAGGIGTYRISGAQQGIASETMTGVATAPLVTYDSVSEAFVITSGVTGAPSTVAFATGTLAAPLLLTSATGAVLSQGAAAATPAAFMNALIQVTSNWVCFMTAFDPDGGSGNTVKQAFAAWKNTQNNRFAYVCWDTDITPTESVPASSSLGQILKANGDSGTCLIYEATDLNLAAFAMGVAASIDFEETNGRTTLAFRNQAGLQASVTNTTVAVNLGGNPQQLGDFGNGYNYFGDVGAANAAFMWFQRGTITGPFAWFDSYINQIWLNNAFQLALLNLQNNSKSIPQNVAGSTLIEGALADPIAAGLNFGAFGPGTLSLSQIAAVNSAAGANVAGTIQTQGYYLQVLPASPLAKSNRGSPPCKFWYLDNGSVQSINLASVAIN